MNKVYGLNAGDMYGYGDVALALSGVFSVVAVTVYLLKRVDFFAVASPYADAPGLANAGVVTFHDTSGSIISQRFGTNVDDKLGSAHVAVLKGCPLGNRCSLQPCFLIF